MENQEENQTTEATQGTVQKQMPYTVDYCPRKSLNPTSP